MSRLTYECANDDSPDDAPWSVPPSDDDWSKSDADPFDAEQAAEAFAEQYDCDSAESCFENGSRVWVRCSDGTLTRCNVNSEATMNYYASEVKDEKAVSP